MQQRIEFSSWRRLSAGFLIGAVIAAVLLAIWSTGSFSTVRARLNDTYYVERDTGDTVVIVAIDNQSLDTYGRFAEWPRTLYADFVNIMAENCVRVVVFDILFADPSQDEAADQALTEAMLNARCPANRARTRIVMPISGEPRSVEAPNDIVRFDYWVRPEPQFAQSTSNTGFVNVLPDNDGAIRWQPMRGTSSLTDDAAVELSLSAVTYLAYHRISRETMDPVVDYRRGVLQLAGLDVPLDDQGRLMVNYFGRPESDDSFAVYSFADVLARKVDAAALNDKIVLLGVMNATGINDNYPIPSGFEENSMAGVAIHANIIESLLQEKFILPQDSTSQGVLIAAFAILSSLLYAQFRWRGIAVMAPVLTIGWVLLAILYANGIAPAIYNDSHIHTLNLLDPALALLLPAPAVLALNLYLETRRREWTEMLLESAVNASGKQLQLAGILESIASDTRRLTGVNSLVEIWLMGSEGFKPAYPPDSPGLHRTLAQRSLDSGKVENEGPLVAVPLIWRDKKLGTILIETDRRVNVFRRRVLTLFGWQTASILTNAELYQASLELSDLKTRMIRIASHDLNYPIGAVIGYSEIMLDIMETETEHARFIESILTAATQMEAIVSDILNLERVRSGHLTIEPFDLRDIVSLTTNSYQYQMEQKELTLTLRLPDDFPIINGDQSQIREAIGSLVSNAVKYTQRGGTIRVTLQVVDNMARITVADNGPGIPREAQAQLFQEFYRVRSRATADIEGTGLGLSLVKSVADAHGGRVWLESEEGKGSRFYMDLPINGS